MKKITLWLFALFTCWQISAQTGTVVVGVSDGSPNTSTGYPSPLQDNYKTQRMQILYTAAELSGAGLVAGNITEIGWVATALNASTLQENYTISMKSTASTVLTGTFETGATVVYGPADFTPSATGNVMFTLTTPFVWDGTSNVIIELCAGLASGAWTSNVSCANSTTSGIQTVYYRNDSATAPCTQATGTTSNQRPLLVATGNVASCLAPLNIVFNNVTSSTADISWDPVSPVPGIGYEYVVSTSNVAPTGAGTATIPVFASLTGLNPQTTYYIFVRSNCSAGVFSGWNGPVSFTTACGAYPVPLVENFTTFLPSACWFNRTGGDLTTGPTTLTGSGWVADGFANVGTTGAVRNEIFTTGANDWFISPSITIPTAGYELKFDAAATQFGSVNSPTNTWEADDTIEVLVSTTGLTNWTPLFTYNDVNQPSNAGSPNIIDLDAYAGSDIRIAFRAVEGATNGSADIDFSIDNFQIRLTPTCVEPLNLIYSSVTTSTVNISWDPTSPSPTIGYEYFVSTSNATPVTAGTATTATFAALSGLLPNTTYYVFVRSDCSAGDFSSWTGPISFYTGYCLPSSTGNATYVNNFTTTGGSQNISNLATGFTTGGYLNATSQFVEGYATSSFNFNAEIVGGTAGFAIWIDWNNDMIFNNATERVFNTTAYANGPFTGLISIPAGTPIGNYRMRITTDWNASNPSNPCAAVARAEFEDYTVSVIAAPACVPPVATVSGVTNVSANLNWAAVPSAVLGYEYVLDNVATDPAGSGTPTTSTSYAASGLMQSTTYYFHIRSVCSVGTYSAWSTVSFTTIATPPVNDNCATAIAISSLPYTNTQDATAASQTAFVTACADTMNDGVWYTVTGNGYDIIVDINAVVGWDPQVDVYTGSCGVFSCVGSADDGGTSGSESFTITASTVGTTYYINVGYWSEFTNSPEGPFTINISSPLNADSFDKSTFVAYPNPVKDVLNLSYKTAISNVRVVNLLGQEVLNTKTNNTNDVQVNMSALTAGAYIVNITVEDTVHTIKVIKE